ncbi:MAG: AAA-like domain-containing protein [Ruminococcus flavefaciens]|nr:AAA-like domain-containing protein [Ruminococcus flavefaciens]
MKRKFNITGSCNPQRHYMVQLDDRLQKIKEDYVDEGCYFIINRGRQYGKTTTLAALEKYLRNDYIVISLDFQEVGTEDFADASKFVRVFAKMIVEALEILKANSDKNLLEPLIGLMENSKENSLKELFSGLSRMCAEAFKPVVLMIDEVDSASNNQVFVDFLAQLRGAYLAREKKPIFQSVVLAGVYDIKNLKLKLRPDAEHKYNSPWNIAAKFDIDMSFSAKQIASMLQEYEADYNTGMEIQAIAEGIYEYTSGYPYLVSAICKALDEELVGKAGFECVADAWTKEGITQAVRSILNERSALFESMIHQLEEYPEMKQILKAVLFLGKRVSYNPDTEAISLASMFGYIVNKEGSIQVANRIFEMRLYNLFLSEEELSNAIYDKAQGNKSQFISGSRLDMDLVVQKFVLYFQDIYGEKDEKFVESQGRKLFLLYLRPIINGTGNYYIEAQTRDARRTDVMVDYLGEQFIIELKIWYGNEYNERGERQFSDYLDYYHINKGYMISFNFNKNKKAGIREIKIGNKTLIEAVV